MADESVLEITADNGSGAVLENEKPVIVKDAVGTFLRFATLAK